MLPPFNVISMHLRHQDLLVICEFYFALSTRRCRLWDNWSTSSSIFMIKVLTNTASDDTMLQLMPQFINIPISWKDLGLEFLSSIHYPTVISSQVFDYLLLIFKFIMLFLKFTCNLSLSIKILLQILVFNTLFPMLLLEGQEIGFHFLVLFLKSIKFL